MELNKVKEIYETSSLNAANTYLGWGWILLAVASMNTNSKDYDNPLIIYSLGWVKDEEPKHYA